MAWRARVRQAAMYARLPKRTGHRPQRERFVTTGHRAHVRQMRDVRQCGVSSRQAAQCHVENFDRANWLGLWMSRRDLAPLGCSEGRLRSHRGSLTPRPGRTAKPAARRSAHGSAAPAPTASRHRPSQTQLAGRCRPVLSCSTVDGHGGRCSRRSKSVLVCLAQNSTT